MSSLGEKLRAARARSGLELAELASRTKIAARFLEAIENDRRDLLPGGFFYKNWASQYAGALSLDVAEIQADADRILSADAPLPLPGEVLPASKSEPRGRLHMVRGDSAPRLLVSLSSLIAVLLACSGLYAWWHKDRPTHQAALQTAPVPPGQSSVKPARSRMDALLLELYAREQTWLAISPDGRQTFSGVLKANESKTIQARESARIKVGNAGGLDVRLNGKPLGEIGPRGKVRVLVVGWDGVHIFQQKNAAAPELTPVAATARSQTAFEGGAAFSLTLDQ